MAKAAADQYQAWSLADSIDLDREIVAARRGESVDEHNRRRLVVSDQQCAAVAPTSREVYRRRCRASALAGSDYCVRHKLWRNFPA